MSSNISIIDPPAWNSFVSEVIRGDTEACESLYLQFSSFRYFFRRSVGCTDAEDLYQELIVDVLSQVRDGRLREPTRLAGYVRAIAVRKLADFIGRRARARARETPSEGVPIRYGGADPEHEAIDGERTKIALRVLTALPARDREVLVRFYLREEKPERIQADLSLTPTQFRLIKSRAKVRYVRLCQNSLGPPRQPTTNP